MTRGQRKHADSGRNACFTLLWGWFACNFPLKKSGLQGLHSSPAYCTGIAFSSEMMMCQTRKTERQISFRILDVLFQKNTAFDAERSSQMFWHVTNPQLNALFDPHGPAAEMLLLTTQ